MLIKSHSMIPKIFDFVVSCKFFFKTQSRVHVLAWQSSTFWLGQPHIATHTLLVLPDTGQYLWSTVWVVSVRGAGFLRMWCKDPRVPLFGAGVIPSSSVDWIIRLYLVYIYTCTSKCLNSYIRPICNWL